MSVSGVCQICERGDAQFACDRCGAVVCEAHYDAETGYCTECAAEARGGPGGPGSTGPS
ncbi:MAG: hypothetical protein ABEH83_01285 [Halobacterium sp.]